MVSIGYFLSCEEFGPRELVRQAEQAADAGFERFWISDHYHPWNDQQGQSPFVWSVLGVGSGEALNEHILGDPWPNADVRLEMLEEAVEVIRLLHEGGSRNHRGRHYTVANARVYTLPDQPVPIYVSAFGPKAARLTGRIGDGFACTMPDADLLRTYREAGGQGPAQGGFKVCHAPTAGEGLETAHRIWPNEGLPGELAQVLPQPKHFEQASQLVTPDMMSLPTGPDPEPYVEKVRSYVDAGFDEVYVARIGPRQEEFFQFWRDKVASRVA